jgi:DNA-binding CsgD family transcriptional regulator
MSMSGNSENCRFDEHFARVIYDSLSAHMAILDSKGTILSTNRAWQSFAQRNNMQKGFESIGINYLEVCDSAAGEDAHIAKAAAEGIRKVLCGELTEFLYDYPCHSETKKHWFYMRVFRTADAERVRVVVSHEEITALKLAEEALKEKNAELEMQKKELEEANIAMKVILKRREGDRVELEETVLTNMKELVFPHLRRMKRGSFRKEEKLLLEILEKNLKNIVSPFVKRLSSLATLLTPQELQVATLVKDGKTSKEIADILNVSLSTVNFHRKNLRIKFGLNNRQVNLATYLFSLT